MKDFVIGSVFFFCYFLKRFQTYMVIYCEVHIPPNSALDGERKEVNERFEEPKDRYIQKRIV